MSEHTRLVPGYRIKGHVAIYGGGHVALGPRIWQQFTGMLEEGRDVWLEFGPGNGWEYYDVNDRTEEWKLKEIG